MQVRNFSHKERGAESSEALVGRWRLLQAVLSSGTLTAFNIAMVLPSRWDAYMKNT